jgi:hypothetical protein
MMLVFRAVLIAASCALVEGTRADDVFFGYEGDASPGSLPGDWIVANPCTGECTEFVEDGHFVLYWAEPADAVAYVHIITQPPQPSPPSLWIEWQLRSNHPLGEFFYSCGAWVILDYRFCDEFIKLYGDTVIAFEGGVLVADLSLDSFHTYRFASLDGRNYTVSVDGAPFLVAIGNDTTAGDYFEFGGLGGCSSEPFVGVRNEWDMIRYGTIGFGERIVGAEPAGGFLDPQRNAEVRRVVVTWDAPNYAYIDDISVEVTCDSDEVCPAAPVVIATKRLDNGPPEVLEIVLDRRLPPDARTVFTFHDDNPDPNADDVINTVAYTFQRGDMNADGNWDIRDFAAMQNCFFTLVTTNTCAAFDYDGSIFVDPFDVGRFISDVGEDGP